MAGEPLLTNKSMEEFNRNKKILLSNIPPSTAGEIQDFIGTEEAKKIDINESLKYAVVTLQDVSQVEETVRRLDGKKLKDNDVTVSTCVSNKLLCVAHLPPRYSDDEFCKLIAQYGSIKFAFVMRSETTGQSKSYGFVEFEEQDLEKVDQLRKDIDWKEVGSQVLHADFIAPSQQTWDQMQSRCLAIGGLPKDFKDISKLRDIFSPITSPVYCQIVVHEKESQGLGIVEYRLAEDAEKTWEKLKNTKIEDEEIGLTFCIPSKPAVSINNRIMWKLSEKSPSKSTSPPEQSDATPVIANNAIVLSLLKQNPNLLEDFTKVLMELQQAYVTFMMCPGNKPGLLGPAPSLPMSPMKNPHLQLGLMTMLVLYMHTAKNEPFTGMLAKQLNSLSETVSSSGVPDASRRMPVLGDPLLSQANTILTNLKQQLQQVPVSKSDSVATSSSVNPALHAVLSKFLQNARYLNLSLLISLGEVVSNMQASSHQDTPMAQAAAAVAASMARHSTANLLGVPGTGQSLLGETPKASTNPAAVGFMKTLEAVASKQLGGQNQGFLSALMTNISASTKAMGTIEKKSSLLGQPTTPVKQRQPGNPGTPVWSGIGNMGGMGNMGSMMNMTRIGGMHNMSSKSEMGMGSIAGMKGMGNLFGMNKSSGMSGMGNTGGMGSMSGTGSVTGTCNMGNVLGMGVMSGIGTGSAVPGVGLFGMDSWGSPSGAGGMNNMIMGGMGQQRVNNSNGSGVGVGSVGQQRVNNSNISGMGVGGMGQQRVNSSGVGGIIQQRVNNSSGMGVGGIQQRVNNSSGMGLGGLGQQLVSGMGVGGMGQQRVNSSGVGGIQQRVNNSSGMGLGGLGQQLVSGMGVGGIIQQRVNNSSGMGLGGLGQQLVSGMGVGGIIQQRVNNSSGMGLGGLGQQLFNSSSGMGVGGMGQQWVNNSNSGLGVGNIGQQRVNNSNSSGLGVGGMGLQRVNNSNTSGLGVGNIGQQKVGNSNGGSGIGSIGQQRVNSSSSGVSGMGQQRVNNNSGIGVGGIGQQRVNSDKGMGGTGQQTVNNSNGSGMAQQSVNSFGSGLGGMGQQGVNNSYGSGVDGMGQQGVNSSYGSGVDGMGQQGVNNSYGSGVDGMGQQGVNNSYGSGVDGTKNWGSGVGQSAGTDLGLTAPGYNSGDGHGAGSNTKLDNYSTFSSHSEMSAYGSGYFDKNSQFSQRSDDLTGNHGAGSIGTGNNSGYSYQDGSNLGGNGTGSTSLWDGSQSNSSTFGTGVHSSTTIAGPLSGRGMGVGGGPGQAPGSDVGDMAGRQAGSGVGAVGSDRYGGSTQQDRLDHSRTVGSSVGQGMGRMGLPMSDNNSYVNNYPDGYMADSMGSSHSGTMAGSLGNSGMTVGSNPGQVHGGSSDTFVSGGSGTGSSSEWYRSGDYRASNTVESYDMTANNYQESGTGTGYGSSIGNDKSYDRYNQPYDSYNQSSTNRSYDTFGSHQDYNYSGQSGELQSTTTPITPAGTKRSYGHLLPQPEPSPEGDYVGQHSQGLGGHYQKRPRLF